VPFCGFGDGYYRNGGQSMNKITPFLWFNDNAEDAAEFYLSVFPEAKKVGELRSSGVGPGPPEKAEHTHPRLINYLISLRLSNQPYAQCTDLCPGTVGSVHYQHPSVIRVPDRQSDGGSSLFSRYILIHWCPVKYFATVDKPLAVKRIAAVRPKNDLS
jgi:3-demethylubiquinone-9 3-methyltransferase